jgi:hypothetical protein
MTQRAAYFAGVRQARALTARRGVYPRATISGGTRQATIFDPTIEAPVTHRVAAAPFLKGELLIATGETYFLVQASLASGNPFFRDYYFIVVERAGVWRTSASLLGYRPSFEASLIEAAKAYRADAWLR